MESTELGDLLLILPDVLKDASKCKGAMLHQDGGNHYSWLPQSISKNNEYVDQQTFMVPTQSPHQSVGLLYLDTDQFV